MSGVGVGIAPSEIRCGVGEWGMQEWDLSEDQLGPQIFSWHLVPLSHFALSPLQKGKSSAALNPDICSFLICYARMGSGAAKEIWCTLTARVGADEPGAWQGGRAPGVLTALPLSGLLHTWAPLNGTQEYLGQEQRLVCGCSCLCPASS